MIDRPAPAVNPRSDAISRAGGDSRSEPKRRDSGRADSIVKRPEATLVDASVWADRSAQDSAAKLTGHDGSPGRILPIEVMHVIRSSTRISLATLRGFEQMDVAFDARMIGAVRALTKGPHEN